MASESKSSAGGGIGFLGLLGLLFIGLKLGGIIDWSWWLVLLPLYGPLAVVLAVITVAFLIAVLIAVVVKVIEGKK